MKKLSVLILTSAVFLSACGNSNVMTNPGNNSNGILPPPLAGSPTNCLQGNWSSDSTALTAYMRSIMTEVSPTVTAGSIDMSFNGNNFVQSVPSLTVNSSMDGITLSMTMSGAVRGTFQEVSPGSIKLRSDGTSTMRLDSATLNGQPFTSAPIEMGDLFVGQNDTSATYQCGGNTLTIAFRVDDTRTATMVLQKR